MFTSSTKRESRHFHIVVLQWRQRNVQKSVMQVQRCRFDNLSSCLHGGRGPQISEVACGELPHLSCKRDQIKMRDYMDRRVTSPTWCPLPPFKQALNLFLILKFSLPSPSPSSLLTLPSISADPVTFPSLRDEHYCLTSGCIDMHTRKTGTVFKVKPNDWQFGIEIFIEEVIVWMFLLRIHASKCNWRKMNSVPCFIWCKPSRNVTLRFHCMKILFFSLFQANRQSVKPAYSYIKLIELEGTDLDQPLYLLYFRYRYLWINCKVIFN